MASEEVRGAGAVPEDRGTALLVVDDNEVNRDLLSRRLVSAVLKELRIDLPLEGRSLAEAGVDSLLQAQLEAELREARDEAERAAAEASAGAEKAAESRPARHEYR